MTLEDLGNLGDFVGGVAVVATLLYLAIQIRQNTRSLRASTFQAVADSISDLGSQFGVDAELGRIFMTGLQAGAPLSEAEERQFSFMLLTSTRRFENAYFQWRSGVLSNEQYHGFRTATGRILHSPGGRSWWREWRLHFSESFREFVEQEQGAPQSHRAQQHGR